MSNLTIVALLIGCISAANADVRDDIALEIRLSTKQIRLAEPITITGIIKNISKNKITVYRLPPIYSSTSITLFDLSGRPLKDFKLSVFELKPITQSDFVSLEPNNSIALEFEAVLKEDKILGIESRDQKYQGLFLEFSDEDSAILIPKPGSYTIRFNYGFERMFADEWSRQFGFKNLWSGRAISPPVTVTITR
jgi:hypothetical protein